MSSEAIEWISSGLLVMGALPYIYRTAKRKIEPQITSWVLWSFISIAIVLTYKDAGDGATFWGACISCAGPCIIAAMLIYQGGVWNKLELLDYACIACGVFALGCWLWIRKDKDLAQYALYVAIIADFCAAIRTFIFVRDNPSKDRPFAWVVFSLGMAVTLFAVTEYTWANIAYGGYMAIMSAVIALPLVRYRIQHQVPLLQWI